MEGKSLQDPETLKGIQTISQLKHQTVTNSLVLFSVLVDTYTLGYSTRSSASPEFHIIGDGQLLSLDKQSSSHRHFLGLPYVQESPITLINAHL